MLGTHRNAAELVDLYVDLVNRFPSIIALIDPFRKEVTGSTLHFITTQRNLVPPAWWLKCCALAGLGCCTSVRVRGGAHGANAEPEHNGLGAGLGAERTSFSRALGGGVPVFPQTTQSRPASPHPIAELRAPRPRTPAGPMCVTCSHLPHTQESHKGFRLRGFSPYSSCGIPGGFVSRRKPPPSLTL